MLRNQDGSLNTPDSILVALWRHMETQGKAKRVFYNGHIRTEYDWMVFIKDPGNHVLFVVDDTTETICALAWLNGVEDRCAKAHFCILVPYKRGIGNAIMDFWKGFRWPDGTPTLKTLVGLTPESYDQALRAIKILGFKTVGSIPDICDMVYENRREAGVITYYHVASEGGV